MSFDWSEYFRLAFELDIQARSETNPQTQEAKWRSAISRAYYAAWCSARNKLRDEQAADAACLQNHGCVIRKFQESSDTNRRQIGVTLGRMMDNRRRADYHDSVARLADMSNMQILLAQDVILEIDKLVST
ncbi:MAG TPA: hypothetical protein VGE45_04460 [Chloroflexia bacterium]|jgi:uncharacterized protein (UPF0332 family)